MAPVRLDHTRVKFVAGAIVNVKSTALRDTETTLRGLDAELIPIPPFDGLHKKDQNTGADYAEIVVPVEFPPGSVLVFATWVDSLDASLDDFCGSGATEAFAGLDMVDLNPVLFRADGEERDAREFSFCYKFTPARILRPLFSSLQLVVTVSTLFPESVHFSTVASKDGCRTCSTSWSTTT